LHNIDKSDLPNSLSENDKTAQQASYSQEIDVPQISGNRITVRQSKVSIHTRGKKNKRTKKKDNLQGIFCKYSVP